MLGAVCLSIHSELCFVAFGSPPQTSCNTHSTNTHISPKSQTINIVLCYAIYKVSKQSRANVKILSFGVCVSVNCCVLLAVKCNLVLCQSNWNVRITWVAVYAMCWSKSERKITSPSVLFEVFWPQKSTKRKHIIYLRCESREWWWIKSIHTRMKEGKTENKWQAPESQRDVIVSVEFNFHSILRFSISNDTIQLLYKRAFKCS